MPKRRSESRFSRGTLFETVAVNLYPLAFASIASAIPVLPDVGSTGGCGGQPPVLLGVAD